MFKLVALWTLLICACLPLGRSQRQQKQIEYFLKKAGLQRRVYSLENARNGQLANTNLDRFRDVYSSFRLLLLQNFKENEKYFTKIQRQRGKLQPRIPKTEKFPCDVSNGRSKEPPQSVHRLRPGDIDIIGALGDSLTAGTAILADGLVQGSAEFRGVVATGGGLKDWRTYLTLPNILKLYNPNLYGYAIENTLARERPARFSVGEPSATTQDMPFQAHVLVRRLQRDPKVDMAKHWKLITLFIGSNDACSDMCHYDNWDQFLENHRQDMYKTLSILKAHVPRLLVNVIPLPNIQETIRVMRNIPLGCFVSHRIACHCIISDRFNSTQLEKIDRTIRRMQQIDEEVAALPEFQTDDFAAAFRGFTSMLSLTELQDGSTDLSFFADDCFHLSQYGQATFANTLWNNMVQGVSPEDKLYIKPFEKFQCPSERYPYIATLKNNLGEIK